VSARAVLVTGFGLIFAAMLVVDLATRRWGRVASPLGTALTAAMRSGAGRLVVLGVWLWLGWHFLAR
jgi:hypothetical protein